MIRYIVISLMFMLASNAYANNSYAPLFEKVNPAVVSISVVDESISNRFKHLGSGFITDESGYIVTNHHVIGDIEELEVKDSKENIYQARVAGKDAQTDLALLKIESAKPLPFIELSDTDSSKIGDWVVALGKPYTGASVMNVGIISFKGIAANDDQPYLQTNLTIHKSMSGGPLLNESGKAIGIIQPIMSNPFSSASIALATPISYIVPLIKELKNNGRIARGWLGVIAQDINDDMTTSLNLEGKKGVLVSTVMTESSAEKAGVQVGDVILSIDSKDINNINSLPKVVRNAPVNKQINLEVIRDKAKKTLSVILEEPKDEPLRDAKRSDEAVMISQDIIGLKVADINDQVKAKYGLKEDARGVVVISNESFEAQFETGDIISQVNQQKVSNVGEFTKEVKALQEKGTKTVIMLCTRNDINLFITIKL